VTEGEIAIVEAIRALGAKLGADVRAEILPLREEVARLAVQVDQLARDVGLAARVAREETAAVRRDIDGIRQTLVDEAQGRVEQLGKKAR
jgi:hypothetical protein